LYYTTPPIHLKEGFLSASESDERTANDGNDETVVPPLKEALVPDLQVSLAEISGGLNRLESRFDSRFAYDATKEAAFRHMYADLQDAKLAQSLEATRPLLLDLLLLFDRVDLASRSSKSADEASALGSFREELLEILYRRDVRTFMSASNRYDRETQQVVGVVDTSEADEHQLVERIVRAGFRWGTRILRPEDVVIRRYRAAVPPSEELTGGTQ
jgi:molecular chaperone GrpE (heat shock protein)